MMQNKSINYRGDIMPNSINKILEEFSNKVKILLGDRVNKIILYGSYARGDYNKDSDIDIMILTDLNFKEIEEYRDKISDIAYEIEEDNDFNITLSPLIKNIDNYNKRINVIPFYMNVQRDGVVLDG